MERRRAQLRMVGREGGREAVGGQGRERGEGGDAERRTDDKL